MKKLYLLLAAATLMLASCMQENLTPDRPADGQVTIKAVAADTKTLLDGTMVVWENEDQIKVVVDAEYMYAYDFDAVTVDGAAANFVGTIGQSEYDAAYAVYPASAVNVDNTTWVTHTLAETQTGVVTSGMNLSSALLDAEALKNGEATATFKNALTLLQVTVPSGVASVALTSSALDNGLVGTASFTMNADGALVSPSRTTQRRTVTLSTGSELEAGTYSLLVYPGNYSSLTLTMTGTDGAVYESTISATFVAGEYRPIDLTEIFKMETEDEMFISPAGGECEVKIASVAEYTYEVSITDNTDNWLSCTLPTKGFHQDVITFSAEENTTGADRTANVTITWGEGEDQTRTFNMTQKSVFMDFVDDENGDPIQWEENFKLYSEESLTSELATFTNVFTIELSDDFSKGTYKLKNLFVVDMYYGEGYQMITNKGGDYYANYDAATGNLTVLKANAVASYTFPGDVVLTYDSVNKTFSATTLTVTLSTISAYYASGATRYIGGYSAAVKETEDPGTSGGNVDPLVQAVVGTYKESHTGTWPVAGTVEIKNSDDTSKGNIMLIFSFDTSAKFYATVAGTETNATIEIADGQFSNNFGSIDGTITIMASYGAMFGELNFIGMGSKISDYSATKQ